MNPDDAHIVAVVKQEPRSPTYVYKNMLRRRFPSVKTEFVRRRLRKLQAAGLVDTVETAFKSQLFWVAI